MSSRDADSSAAAIWTSLAALGVVLVAAGLAWPLLLSDRQLLSESDAREYVEAAVGLHASTVDEPGHGQGPAHAHDHTDEARERFDRAAQKVERARFAQDWGGRLLVGVGFLLTIAGGIGASRSQPSGSR